MLFCIRIWYCPMKTPCLQIPLQWIHFNIIIGFIQVQTSGKSNIKILEKLWHYKLKSPLPNTRFCWSSILPGTNWRYSKNTKAMNFAVKRINNYMCNLFKVNGDSFIQHPQILWNSKNLFMTYGVHLSQLGNNSFLHNVQEHLEDLLNKNNVWREWATLIT